MNILNLAAHLDLSSCPLKRRVVFTEDDNCFNERKNCNISGILCAVKEPWELGMNDQGRVREGLGGFPGKLGEVFG